jgi:hypothetical protein
MALIEPEAYEETLKDIKPIDIRHTRQKIIKLAKHISRFVTQFMTRYER